MIKYARNNKGEIIKDFAGNPFTFQMREDADGFLRDILGYSHDEYSIHYHVMGRKKGQQFISAQDIEAARNVA